MRICCGYSFSTVVLSSLVGKSYGKVSLPTGIFRLSQNFHSEPPFYKFSGLFRQPEILFLCFRARQLGARLLYHALPQAERPTKVSFLIIAMRGRNDPNVYQSGALRPFQRSMLRRCRPCCATSAQQGGVWINFSSCEGVSFWEVSMSLTMAVPMQYVSILENMKFPPMVAILELPILESEDSGKGQMGKYLDRRVASGRFRHFGSTVNPQKVIHMRWICERPN